MAAAIIGEVARGDNAASGTTWTATLTAPVPKGDSIVIAFGALISVSTLAAPQVTDSRGNTYVIGAWGQRSATTWSGTASAYAATALQVGDTITIVLAQAGTQRAMLALRASGLSAAPLAANVNNDSASATGTAHTFNVTSQTAGQLIFAVDYGGGQLTSFTPAAGSSAVSWLQSGRSIVANWRISTAASAVYTMGGTSAKGTAFAESARGSVWRTLTQSVITALQASSPSSTMVGTTRLRTVLRGLQAAAPSSATVGTVRARLRLRELVAAAAATSAVGTVRDRIRLTGLQADAPAAGSVGAPVQRTRLLGLTAHAGSRTELGAIRIRIRLRGLQANAAAASTIGHARLRQRITDLHAHTGADTRLGKVISRRVIRDLQARAAATTTVGSTILRLRIRGLHAAASSGTQVGQVTIVLAPVIETHARLRAQPRTTAELTARTRTSADLTADLRYRARVHT